MYKITIYERKNYPDGGQVILDTSSGENPGITTATCEMILNEAGKLSFGISPIHPNYEDMKPLETYVSVEDEGTEIFYGRVLMVQTNRITKDKTVTCEGAFSFLMDIEMDADENETTYTATNYFSHCLSVFNTAIANDGILNDDKARRLRVGTVNVPKKNESKAYKNTSCQQVQQVMKNMLLSNYDGFFNVRRDGTNHYLDWLAQVGSTNPQTVQIAQNITNYSSSESGEDIFSKIWPKGNDKIKIDPISLSTAMVRKYGVIVKSVNFDANDANTLRTKANEYIEKLRNRLSLSNEIGFVDMHYLDGTIPKVKLGDVFTGIEGYVGTNLTVANIKRDLLNPANDKFSLKTDKDLMSSAGSNGSNSNSRSTGGSSGSGRRSSFTGGSSNWYKYIHETTDALSLATKTIEISANERFSVVAGQISMMGENIELVSATSLETKGQWETFKGTGVYQNRDHIAQVAGKFSVNNDGDVLLNQGTEFIIDQNGTSINVGTLLVNHDNRVDSFGQWMTEYEGSYAYQHDSEIGDIVGRYTIETYIDPAHPYVQVEVGQDDNPKELGLYELVNDEYVKTRDETVVAGKKYYKTNDKQNVIFDSGGGYKIKRDGVEYGVYDSNNLTGGIIVEKLNDGTVTAKIKGSRVVIGPDLTDEDLATWAGEAAAGTGVFAKFLTVQTLTAQTINAALVNAALADIGSIDVGEMVVSSTLDAGSISSGEYWISTPDGQGGHDLVQLLPSKIADITLNSGNNTLTITYNDGTPSITFRKATTITGAWSSGTLTVSADLASIPSYIRTLSAGSPENADGTPYTSGSTWYVPINALWGSSGQYTESTGWRVYVNASSAETSGKNSVKVTGPTWSTTPSASISGNSNTATFTTDAPNPNAQAAKSLTLLMNSGSWSNGSKWVYVNQADSTDANRIARLEVTTSISSIVKSGTAAYSANYKTVTFDVTATANTGATGTQSVSCDVTDSYNAGVNSVGLIVVARGSGMSRQTYIVAATGVSPVETELLCSTDAGTLSDGSRQVKVYAGTTVIGGVTITDYKDGWSAAAGRCSVPYSAGSGSSIAITWPSSVYDYVFNRTFEIADSTNNKVVLRYNSSSASTPNYVNVAEYSHNKWNAGWDNAEGLVALPTAQISTGSMTITVPKKTGSSRGSGSVSYELRVTNNDAYISVEEDGSYTDYAKVTHNKYYAGKASVSLSNAVTWTNGPSSSITANNNGVTISTSGKTTSSGTENEATKTINLYTQTPSWSGTTCNFYVTQSDSTDANRILKRSVDVSGKLDTISITSNGTYTPSSNYIGFSSVVVDVAGAGELPVVTFSSELSSSGTRGGTSAIYVYSDTSAGRVSSPFYLKRTTFTPSSGTARCVDFYYTSGNRDISIGRINTQSVYNEGYTAAENEWKPSESDIKATAGTVGTVDEPTGMEIWSTTNFVRNRWYTLKITCKGAEKMYKLHATW